MKKRALSIILALALLIGMLPIQANAATLDNGIMYEVYEDHVEIIGYTGYATEVVIPAEIEGLPVTSIGNYAFESCYNLTNIVIPQGVTSIGESAFDYCSSLTDIVIPQGVTSIGNYAFCYCTSLTSIVIPDSVTSIGKEAFYHCISLTSIVIPEGVTSISDQAFSYCTSLTDIVIPDSVTSIGYAAFGSCSSLTDIVIPDSVTSIGLGAFARCSSLTDIVIPQGVTSIGESAFSSCSSLTDIVIPQGVTSIGRSTFESCSSLTDIVIPQGVTFIGVSAFESCSSLTSIVIPDSVTAIGNFAFSDCSSLTDIVIPDSVTSIGYGAFSSCSSLKSIFFNGDAPFIGDYAFNNVNATAYYPEGNPTWTEDVMQDYGGTITWVAYDSSHTHEYTAAVTAPTCTEEGYTTYTCSCGDSYVSDYVDALGHDYADGICTRCGEADPDYVKPVENPFTDVPAGCWYEAPVLWALENGITSGTSENSFSPNNQCLRSHVATFLWAAEGKPEPSSYSNLFTDVSSSDWFYRPVLWAVENGITSGVSPDRFGANDVCSRYQVVFFLWKAAGSPEPTSTQNPFTDVQSTDFFYKAVLWAVENGITSGTSETTFSPTQPCNRAQVVTFLYAAYN